MEDSTKHNILEFLFGSGTLKKLAGPTPTPTSSPTPTPVSNPNNDIVKVEIEKERKKRELELKKVAPKAKQRLVD